MKYGNNYRFLSGDLGLDSLGEVRAHKSLEVEVGELILLLKLKEGNKLGIRVDLATIVLILEVVRADVGVDLLGHVSASHFRTFLLSEEDSKLIADTSRLDESRRSTVTGLALTLGGLLLGGLELTRPLLLKSAVLRL